MTELSGCPRILVIGGGFAGAAFALHLIRHNPRLSVHIEIIEPKPQLGAGLAYSTGDPAHRINVAAARMALYAEDPTHFDRWFRESEEAESDREALTEDGRAFPRRAAFGRYVDQELRAAARLHKFISLDHVRARAIGATYSGYRYQVTLDDGSTRTGDLLVLAPGHPPPAQPHWAVDSLRVHPGYVADPWRPDALDRIRPVDDVLIVGTGLTMADVVASLRIRGHVGDITAVSRRGLTPRPRTLLPVEASGDFETNPERSAARLLRRVRTAVRRAGAEGKPWECVVDAIRQQAVTIWQALSIENRRRFLRHLRPYWDVHRYQIAPQIHAVLNREQRMGRLRVLAARLESIHVGPGSIDVYLQTARGQQSHAQSFSAIVNCTGPDHRSVVNSNPVLASLAHAGLLQAEPLGLGIAVDLQSRVIDRRGQPNDTLLISGPLARGTFGELMGLPQVSTQPERVAAYVAEVLQAPISLASARKRAASA